MDEEWQDRRARIKVFILSAVTAQHRGVCRHLDSHTECMKETIIGQKEETLPSGRWEMIVGGEIEIESDG